MVPKGGLYTCDDPARWRAVLNVYQEVVAAKGSKQKNLIALDNWYQEELPKSIMGREIKHLTKQELIKLMEWKLSRGKFRPRLQQLVATNAEEVVEQCTKKGFQLLPDVAAAISELSRLKGVGPATASAILAAGAPDVVPFMADEAVASISGLAPIQYTLKHYMHYLDQIQSRVKKLNKADPVKTWTPHHVEMCLWAWSVAEKLQLSLVQTSGMEKEEASCCAETDMPSKRRKTE
ncbi:uncharacterized protein LOC123025224 [Varanus komodoensis]|uniref:Uncharacterized protein n=1 Tax=Varanus komodoensis TaxID=61221 RepID=A0A8D2L4K2_VARKO|nr:uncharacterized protein LOC123025224 [Varanus komodoensis]